ncbi:MAG: response regulator [Xanthomonadales bacterium]|nr:response regulator [Xanthomonadales bacterium]
MMVGLEDTWSRGDDLAAWELLRCAFAALDREQDPACVAQAAIDAAVELAGAELGVLLYEPDGEAGYRRHAVSGTLPILPQGASATAVALHLLPCSVGPGPRHCSDVTESLAEDAAIRSSGIRNCLAVPVALAGGEPQGRIVLGHSRPGMFRAHAEAAVGALAAYLARVIGNRRAAPAAGAVETTGFSEAVEQRVTERTEELRRNELQLERLISGIADYAIFLLDADGLVQTWNTGAERSTGYAAAEVIGNHFSCFYTPEDRAAGAPAHSLSTARDKGIYEAEGWRIRKDGTRYWASVLLDAIHDAEGNVVGFAKVTRDMTERRALEEHLHQARRMEAIGRLTGGVAHDFNNLLTVILGNLDTICRETASMPQLHIAADDAMRAAKRSATLTRQLLAFSRRQPLNPQPTDVNRLVGSVAGLLRRTFGETIAIATDLGDGVALARVDATQLESALINLAMNARDVMPAGGVLAISTTPARLEDPDEGLLHGDPRDYILISVADSGPGMTEEVREHAFEPFFTTKPLGRGTGLGLSQVYGFVRQSGGHVRIRSDPGHGTTVTIALPRHAAAPGGEILHDGPEAAPRPRGEAGAAATILLVEDNDGVRRFSAVALRDLGFTVIEAPDAELALERLDEEPGIDLLFTDIGLPRMSGDKLAEEALRRRPGLRVLYTTGYAPDAIADLPGLVEGVNLLRKPYMREQALERIRAVLAAPDGGTRAFRLLVVEDDPLLRDLTARMLAEMHVEVHVAGSVAEVRSLVGRGRSFDAALVDLELGDGHGRDAALVLRSRQRDLPIILTSGFGDADLEQVDLEGEVEILRKPYSRDELRRLVIGVRAAAAA